VVYRASEWLKITNTRNARSHLGSAGRGQAVGAVQAGQSHLEPLNEVKCIAKNLTVRFFVAR
jgi:hypothetical protein